MNSTMPRSSKPWRHYGASLRRRHALGERAREIILNRHTPAECARRYAKRSNVFIVVPRPPTPALIRAIAAQKTVSPTTRELFDLSKDLAVTLPLQQPADAYFWM